MISVRACVVQEEGGLTLGRIPVKYDAHRLCRWFGEQGHSASVGLDLSSKMFFVRIPGVTWEELAPLVAGSKIDLM